MRLLNKFMLESIAILLSMGFLWAQNNIITVSNIEYKNEKVTEDFENFSILQVSDLHGKQFGADQKRLIDKTRQLHPDAIVITGDLIDKRRTNLNNMYKCLTYVKAALKIAPVYFVAGNHEAASPIYKVLKKELTNSGVKVLDNKTEKICRGKSFIRLSGINDILFFDDNIDLFEKKINTLMSPDNSSLNILLSHRPDLIEDCKKVNADLILAGHTHGGQFRLPFVGGLINVSPNKSSRSGIHTKGNTTIIISRGLGNSLIPLRFLNYPEIVLITLKRS